MKRWLSLICLVALLAFTGQASAVFTGPCGVWANKRPTNALEYASSNFPGTQAGFDAAKAFVGTFGTIFIYPGCEGTITVGSLPDSVTVIEYSGGRVVTHGTAVTPRLGPYSSPTTGGAIRIVDGVTFPTWAAALADLPATGGGALYPDSSRLLLRNPRACIYLREAVQAGNGATDPAIYSQKTVDLSTTVNSQATKSVDIVSRFSNSTASTNLSLNGAHFINQYGLAGVGGGDVQTGIAIGGYSEHRGNYAITGSLYGAELATTMYNTGSVANAFGTLSTAQVTSGSTSSITTARGIQALARVAGTGNGTIGTAVAVEGIAGMQDTAAGTITTAIGGRFGTIKDGGVTGTITNAYGLNVLAINQGATDNYGIRVIGAYGGAGINRGISVDRGDAFFADSLSSNGSGRVSGDWNVGFANTGTTASTIRMNGGNSGTTAQRFLMLRNNVADFAIQADGVSEKLQYSHYLVFGTPAGASQGIIDTNGKMRLGDATLPTHGLEVTTSATIGDTLRVAGRLDMNNSVILREGVNIASAATITIGNSNCYTVTGTTTCTDIAGPAMPAGKHQIVTFYTTAGWQITGGNHWKINGNFNGNATGNKDALTVDWDGTDATEVGRVIQ